MPWHVEKRSGKFCVVKDADGSQVACHDSRSDAAAQVRALYASEPGAGVETVTAEVTTETPAVAVEPVAPGAASAPWEGVLTVEGVESGDGRMFAGNSLDWDKPPLPLMWQKETSHGGKTDVSVRVGNVDEIWRTPHPEQPDIYLINGRGTIDLGNPDGVEVHRRMGGGAEPAGTTYLSGNSVDVDSVKNASVELVYPEPVATEPGAEPAVEMGANAFPAPELTIYHRGRIRGTTLVEYPAFTEARLALTTVEEAPADGGEGVETFADKSPYGDVRYADPGYQADGTKRYPIDTEEHIRAAWSHISMPRNAAKYSAADLVKVRARIRAAMQRIGAEVAAAPPLVAATHTITLTDVPPREWFTEPIDVPATGALTVTSEGRVYGYLAPTGVRHRSFQDSARYVPLRNVDYSRFHGGETIVADGGRVVTGPVTMNCAHIPAVPGITAAQASDHYENSCSVVASVCVGESRTGVWVAGALMPGVTPEQVTRMMNCRLSGDWRPHLDRPGWRELTAALLVPVPGFPMARTAASVQVADGALVASSVPVQYETPEPVEAPSLRDTAREIAEALGLDMGSRVAVLRARVEPTAAERVEALRTRVKRARYRYPRAYVSELSARVAMDGFHPGQHRDSHGRWDGGVGGIIKRAAEDIVFTRDERFRGLKGRRARIRLKDDTAVEGVITGPAEHGDGVRVKLDSGDGHRDVQSSTVRSVTPLGNVDEARAAGLPPLSDEMKRRVDELQRQLRSRR